MLRELMLRDWILNRTALLISFGIFFAFEIYAVLSMDSPREWLVFAAVYASFLAVAMFVREDKFRATASACVLPVTRADLVRARVVGAWVVVAVALTGAMLLAAVVPGSRVNPAASLDPSTLLIVATAVTVIVALLQPFVIRFGMLGIMIFLVGAQVLGVLVLSLASMLQRQGAGTGRPIRNALAAVSAGLVELREVLSAGLFVVLIVAMLIVVNWLGYRFSVFLFRQREF